MPKFRVLSLIALSLCLSGCVFFSKYNVGKTYIAGAPLYVPQDAAGQIEVKNICLEYQNLRGFPPQEKQALMTSLESGLFDKLSKSDACDMKAIVTGKRKSSLAFGLGTYHGYTSVDLAISYSKNEITFTKQYFAVNRQESDYGKPFDYAELGAYIAYDTVSFASNQKF